MPMKLPHLVREYDFRRRWGGVEIWEEILVFVRAARSEFIAIDHKEPTVS